MFFKKPLNNDLINGERAINTDSFTKSFFQNQLSQQEFNILLTLLGQGHLTVERIGNYSIPLIKPILTEYGVTAFNEGLVRADDLGHYNMYFMQAIFCKMVLLR